MRQFHGRATTHIDASRGVVFALVTDVDRLPSWNGAIEAVVKRPSELATGSEWTVKMHPPRMPGWFSVSQVQALDPDACRFAYRTHNADGNPSYVTWSWEVIPAGEGADVTVTWDCHLKTLDRKLLAGPMRKRQLAREVPASLAALTTALAPD
jgi:uncharacterized protein YndB with AHSA1/START domain